MVNKKYSFQKLTPVSNADISIYEDAIDFVFDNADVKNVAISGAYSSGKSSILESYKEKHKNTRFLHLSLAHFRTHEQENGESEDVVKESVLEGKILNQLIHQIPSERIPQTNFRVKKGVSAKNITLSAVFVSVLIGSIVFLLLASNVADFIQTLPDNLVKTVLSVLSSPYTLIFASLVSIVCAVVFVFSLIKAQKNRNVFRKISLQGNEIEIFEKQDDSYFDKYLNEVLYLFENAEADVIVFEDMDRFNASRIFERLREVNTLVNIQKKKEQKDKYVPLRFFYLLRDDIFVSKDRTKFFDYIIPIVPVVDSSNSYEQFLKHLKDGNLLDKFDQSFLQGLSLYVDDMRILKNIYNEFVVYIHRLNTTDLDWNKMMAMIAYKNLFPRDFSDLQLAKGFVFNLFTQKSRLAKEALVSAKEQQQAMLDRIEWAKKETLTTQQELDDAYAQKKIRSDNNRSMGYAEKQELKAQYEIELTKRKQAVKDILDGNMPKLEIELANINRDISLTKIKSLKDLVTRENIDSIFSVSHSNEIGEVNEFNEIKGSDYFALLKFLIRNGHVDETYTDYMTYFYEDSISANDKTFLRRITDRRGADYTYTLKEPQKVIEAPVLRAVDFEQEETLNFDLLECLLFNDVVPKYATYLKNLIAQIKKTNNFDFVSKFFDTNKANEQLVIKINEQWPEFFSLALQGKAIPSHQIRQYSIDTLYFSDPEAIKAVNIDNCLAKYISNSPDYLAIENPNIERLVPGFSLIGVTFIAIDYDKADKTLFDEVYRQNLYALTFENIALMLKKEYGTENDSDIAHKNCTLIQNHTASPLARYVAKNMSAYMEIIIANCDSYISDDEVISISVLNNTDVYDFVKESYIALLSTTITDITQVKDSTLWTAMMSRGIVVFSVANLISYFQKRSIDATLTEYINNAPPESNFTTIENDFGTEVAAELYDTVSVCNDISTDKYRKILVELGYHFDNYDADNITDEKFDVLIGERLLQMDRDSLEFVRDKYKKHLMSFINLNFDEYLALQTTEVFRLDEAMQIITWDIGDDKKIELLAHTSELIPIVGKRYPDAVSAYIIDHNFKSEDKQSLYANFTQYGERTREVIIKLAAMVTGIKEIISQKIPVDDALLSALLQSDAVARGPKITLFITSIPTLNEDTCQVHFDELGLFDLKGIFTKSSGRRNYEKNNDVTTILDALKANDWIYDYRDDDRNNEKYIVVKNKPQSKA